MPSPKIFIEVVEKATGEVVKRSDASRMSTSQSDRLMRGLSINLDTNRFFVRTRHEARKVVQDA